MAGSLVAGAVARSSADRLRRPRLGKQNRLLSGSEGVAEPGRGRASRATDMGMPTDTFKHAMKWVLRR
jgi:hypothetical protein